MKEEFRAEEEFRKPAEQESHGTEYFQEIPEEKKKTGHTGGKSRRRGSWKFAFYALCAGTLAVSTGMMGDGTVEAGTVASTVSEPETEAGSKVEESVQAALDSTQETEEDLALTEVQKNYLNQIVAAFEADDIDTLDQLLRQEMCLEIYHDVMQEGTYVFSGDEMHERAEFTGTGLKLKAKELDAEGHQYGRAFWGNLTEGNILGEGKMISASTQGGDQPGTNTHYYTGNWKDGAAEGSGTIYCKHEHDVDEYQSVDGGPMEYMGTSHIKQSDEGHGEFVGGELKSGYSEGYQENTGYYDNNVTFKYTYENGIIMSNSAHTEDFVQGREYDSHDSDIGREQDHFWRVVFRD